MHFEASLQNLMIKLGTPFFIFASISQLCLIISSEGHNFENQKFGIIPKTNKYYLINIILSKNLHQAIHSKITQNYLIVAIKGALTVIF